MLTLAIGYESGEYSLLGKRGQTVATVRGTLQEARLMSRADELAACLRRTREVLLNASARLASGKPIDLQMAETLLDEQRRACEQVLAEAGVLP